jgi:regulator of sigma E protease
MSIIYFVLILGVTIFIHELGHFIFAKKAGIYCYEFSLGMGPKIYGFNRKNDETDYSLRLFPIGGYVRMAGEEIEEDKNIDKEKRIQNKTFIQRLFTMIAGALFNFILGIFILFLIGLIYGSPETKPYIGVVDKEYNAYKEGLREGDLILSVDGKNVKSWDDILLIMEIKEAGEAITFKVESTDKTLKEVSVTPTKEVINGKEQYVFGISTTTKKNYGLIEAVKFAFVKFASVYKSMVKMIKSLIVGELGINSLAGPIGIYSVVGKQAALGFENLIYLLAYLSINVGFINLIPFPAFDGGRVLFLIIEKIRKKPVDVKVENIVHTVGFALLMVLMVIISIKDIKNIIG